MKSSLHVVHVATGDLTLLGLGRPRQWNGHVLSIGETDHERIDELAGAPVGRRFKRHLGDRRDRFFATNGLNGPEDVQRKLGIPHAVRHHLVRTTCPFLVHV